MRTAIPDTCSTTSFGPVVVQYDDRLLPPRPWTLAQSAWAARLALDEPPGPILELCCGAGQIGLAAAAWSGRDVVLVDERPAACAWARRNAEGLDIDATVVEADVGSWAPFDGTFPLVIADPPYVPSSAVHVFREDPPHAIDGGADGLTVVRACVRTAAALLHPGSPLLLQLHGPAQAERLAAELPALAPTMSLDAVHVYGATRALVLVRAAP